MDTLVGRRRRPGGQRALTVTRQHGCGSLVGSFSFAGERGTGNGNQHRFTKGHNVRIYIKTWNERGMEGTNRGTGNGERGTGNGERGTGNGEWNICDGLTQNASSSCSCLSWPSLSSRAAIRQRLIPAERQRLSERIARYPHRASNASHTLVLGLGSLYEKTSRTIHFSRQRHAGERARRVSGPAG